MQDFSISPQGSVQALLDAYALEAQKTTIAGRIPTYIPRLATANPRWLAVQVQCDQGQTWAFGDVQRSFALMSVIKPFLLLFLLEHVGSAAVFTRVGTLPSDQPFHSISQLSIDRGFPRNPMINSGAIALADLLIGEDGVSRCQTLCQWLNRRSGANLYLDAEMLASVQSVGNETNRTIARLMAEAGHISSPDTALDTYNHICCLSGTIADLARLGLLLALPQALITVEHQRIVNALMLTCGLYEASGEFAVRVGVPAKSGVSGAVLAIIPQWGTIACYSPALDDTGNSIAGLFLLEKLTQSLSLSIFG